MALTKRGKVCWIRFSHNGKRIQRSTGTSDKVAAQRLHDKLKAEIWTIEKLESMPLYTWQQAVIRWLNENQHKRSLKCDKMHF